MSNGFSGKQTDGRLKAIFDKFKLKFLDGDHELLGRPYPEQAPAQVWNANIGESAGNANANTLEIQINPAYLMPLERRAELENTILHEMLHVYVIFYYRCRGHKGQWGILAEHWGLDQHHCMCRYHGLAANKQGKNLFEVIEETTKHSHTRRYIPTTKYRKRRVLP